MIEMVALSSSRILIFEMLLHLQVCLVISTAFRSFVRILLKIIILMSEGALLILRIVLEDISISRALNHCALPTTGLELLE